MSVVLTDILDPINGNQLGVSILLDPTPKTVDEKVAGLADSEFITKVGFNLSEAFLAPYKRVDFPTLLNGLNDSCEETTPGAKICKNYDFEAKINSCSIEGAAVAGFDLGFDLTGNGSDQGSGRLDNDKTVKFSITGPPILTAKALNDGFITVKGFDVNIAAKVQGIAQDPGSGVIGDPLGGPADEAPGPLPILGAVAAFKASRRLRNRLKPTAAAAPRSA